VTGWQPQESGRGVFAISVAADLVGMAPQSLRRYEECGLLRPARTAGGTRRYSEDDLRRLYRIGELLSAGLNLAGIAAVLDLEHDNERLRSEVQRAVDEPTARARRSTPPQPTSGDS
jgi:DNA-binding transcriptional MerR regulator